MRKLRVMDLRVGKSRRKRKHTDEDSARQRPFLGTTHDGEREPMRGDERVQKRHRCDASDLGQIFSAESFHLSGFYFPLISKGNKLMAYFVAVTQVLPRSKRGLIFRNLGLLHYDYAKLLSIVCFGLKFVITFRQDRSQNIFAKCFGIIYIYFYYFFFFVADCWIFFSEIK